MLFLALFGITSTAVTQEANAAKTRKKSRRKNPDDTPVSFSAEEIKKLVTSENLQKALVGLKAEDLKSVDVKGLVKEFLKVRSGSGDAIDKIFRGKTDEQKKELAQKIFKAYQEAVAFYTENDINLATSLYAEKTAEMNGKFNSFAKRVEGYDADEIESEYTKLVDQFKKEFDSISDKKKQKFLNALLQVYVSVPPAGQDLKSMKRVIREQDRLLFQIKEYQAGPGELKGISCALDAIEKNIKKVMTVAGISAEDQEKLQKILEIYKKSEVQSGKKSSNEYLNDVLDALEVDQTKSGNWAQKIRNIFAIAEDDNTPISDIVSKIESKKDIFQYINAEKWQVLKEKISVENRLNKFLEMLRTDVNARAKNQAKSKIRKLVEQKLPDEDLVRKINGEQDLRELFDDTKLEDFLNQGAGGIPKTESTSTQTKQGVLFTQNIAATLKRGIKGGSVSEKKIKRFKELADNLVNQQIKCKNFEKMIEEENLQGVVKKDVWNTFKTQYCV